MHRANDRELSWTGWWKDSPERNVLGQVSGPAIGSHGDALLTRTVKQNDEGFHEAGRYVKLGLNEYLKSTGTSEIGFTLSPGLFVPIL